MLGHLLLLQKILRVFTIEFHVAKLNKKYQLQSILSTLLISLTHKYILNQNLIYYNCIARIRLEILQL